MPRRRLIRRGGFGGPMSTCAKKRRCAPPSSPLQNSRGASRGPVSTERVRFLARRGRGTRCCSILDEVQRSQGPPSFNRKRPAPLGLVQKRSQAPPSATVVAARWRSRPKCRRRGPICGVALARRWHIIDCPRRALQLGPTALEPGGFAESQPTGDSHQPPRRRARTP